MTELWWASLYLLYSSEFSTTRVPAIYSIGVISVRDQQPLCFVLVFLCFRGMFNCIVSVIVSWCYRAALSVAPEKHPRYQVPLPCKRFHT